MWVIAGLLLGLVVVASLVGYHAGPHTHVLAGVLGIVAAVWLAIMVFDGQSLSLLVALLGADLVVSIGIGALAWHGLRTRPLEASGHRLSSLESAEGIAMSELDPGGIVRVQGENWSAESLNGTLRSGTRVQVIRVDGVRLAVWGEESAHHESNGGHT